MEHFHVSFRPNVKLVSTVRRFTAEFSRRVLVDHEMSEKIALATHELLENAVTYASAGDTGVRIEIVEDLLTIKTWNRSSPDRLQALKATIELMNQESDAEKYYQTMLQKTAYRTEGSGLGLARVRAEADMSVSYAIESDQVCIAATTSLRRRPA